MKRQISIMLVLVLVLALFAGCGGGSTATQAPTQAPATQAPATQAPTGQTEAPSETKWDFSDAKKVNLTYAIYLADADPTTIDTAKYFDMIKEYTEGTVDYTMYAGQTLCNGAEELDAVKNGLADVAFFPVMYGAGQLPLSYIMEKPGVAFDNNKAASYAVREWIETLQPSELSDFKILYAIGQGNGGFLTVDPIKVYEDFAGKQIRCGDALAPVLEAYGIKPTIMVFSEVYEALRTGVVAGFYGLLHAGNSAKLYEVTNYVTRDPYYNGTYIMVMNKGVWESLTDDQQAAIEACTNDAFEDFLAVGREADADVAIQVFKDNGLEIFEFSADDLAKMGEANAPLQEEYANSVTGGAEALALYRELADKYNDLY